MYRLNLGTTLFPKQRSDASTGNATELQLWQTLHAVLSALEVAGAAAAVAAVGGTTFIPSLTSSPPTSPPHRRPATAMGALSGPGASGSMVASPGAQALSGPQQPYMLAGMPGKAGLAMGVPVHGSLRPTSAPWGVGGATGVQTNVQGPDSGGSDLLNASTGNATGASAGASGPRPTVGPHSALPVVGSTSTVKRSASGRFERVAARLGSSNSLDGSSDSLQQPHSQQAVSSSVLGHVSHTIHGTVGVQGGHEAGTVVGQAPLKPLGRTVSSIQSESSEHQLAISGELLAELHSSGIGLGNMSGRAGSESGSRPPSGRQRPLLPTLSLQKQKQASLQGAAPDAAAAPECS